MKNMILSKISSKENSNLTILVPTYNRPAILKDSLNHLMSAGYGDLRLIIYDDGSQNSDKVEQVVKEIWSNYRIIFGGTNKGQAHGRNVLLKECRSTFALFLEDDTYFEGHFDFSPWLERMETDPICAVAMQCIDLETGRIDQPTRITTPTRCPSFLAGAVLFDVKRVLALGGYRSFFRYGFEEPDLAFRMYANGFEVWYDPSLKVTHNHIITSVANRNENEYQKLYVRNGILLSTMNMRLPYGLIRGYVRGGGQFIRKPKRAIHGLYGFFLGTFDTFRYWNKRNPFPMEIMNNWMAANKEWQRLHEIEY